MKPVRFSHLKQIAKSAQHYQYAIGEERTDTASFRLGRAAHRIALGVGEVLVYEKRRAGAEWDDFRADRDPDSIFSATEYAKAKAMANAVRANPLAMRVLGGHIERTLSWDIGGRACSGTPDAFTDDYVTDLKTCKDAHPDRFVRSATWYGYHAQLAWYLDGVRLSGLGTPQDAYVVAVEVTPPHPVTVLQLTDRALEQGRRLCRLWWEQLMVCEQSAHFPGYAQGVVPFDVPDDDFTLNIDGEDIAA